MVFESKQTQVEIVKNKMEYLEEQYEYSKIPDEPSTTTRFSIFSMIDFLSKLLIFIGERLETALFDIYYKLYLAIQKLVFY